MAGGKSRSGRGAGTSGAGTSGAGTSGKKRKNSGQLSSASSIHTNHPNGSPPSISLPRMPSQYSTASEDLRASSSKKTPVVQNPVLASSPVLSRVPSLLHTPPPNRRADENQVLEQEDESGEDVEDNVEEDLEEDVEEDVEDDDDNDENDHQEGPGLQMSLEALLAVEGRANFLDNLSQTEGEGLWFDRDESLLVNRIANILQDKFDGAYYSWKVTPVEIRDRFFIQFAQIYNWNPLITHIVRHHFIVIAKRRLKDMVSYARRNRKKKKPAWIRQTLWDKMVKYWDSKAAKKKSARASKARKSDRGGLGPHKHVGGPKSHAHIQRQMTIEEGRDVSIAEVFIKTRTRKDGTFVDGKAKKIVEVYDQKLQSTQSQLDMDVSMTSDGQSRAPELTTQQKNAIFLESTMVDGRGNPYGLGRMAQVIGKGKKPVVLTSSSTIVCLESKLKEAELKMAQMAEQNRQQLEMTQMVVKYLKQKDPNLPSWLETQMIPPPPAPEDGENNDQGTPSTSN